MGPTAKQVEHIRCPKLNALRLGLAFVLGMSAMIVAIAAFSHISQQRFGLSSTSPDGSVLGGNPDYDDSSRETVSPPTHETKKISYQGEAKSVLGIEVMDMLDSGESGKILITKVVDGSPADEAGLVRGDEILRFDRRRVETIPELKEVVGRKIPNERVKIEILRSGERQSTYVKMGNPVTNFSPWNGTNFTQVMLEETPAHSSRSKMRNNPSDLGITISPWTEELARRYGLESDVKGIVVTDVTPDSKASRAGLMAGDLIRSVNQKSTPDLKSFFNAAQRERNLLLDVFRQGQSIYLAIPDKDDKPPYKRLNENG